MICVLGQAGVNSLAQFKTEGNEKLHLSDDSTRCYTRFGALSTDCGHGWHVLICIFSGGSRGVRQVGSNVDFMNVSPIEVSGPY